MGLGHIRELIIILFYMLNETKLIYYIEEHPINFIQSNVIPTPSGNTKSNKVKLTPLSHIHVQ